jgi:hypothetical protein
MRFIAALASLARTSPKAMQGTAESDSVLLRGYGFLSLAKPNNQSGEESPHSKQDQGCHIRAVAAYHGAENPCVDAPCLDNTCQISRLPE